MKSSTLKLYLMADICPLCPSHSPCSGHHDYTMSCGRWEMNSHQTFPSSDNAESVRLTDRDTGSVKLAYVIKKGSGSFELFFMNPYQVIGRFSCWSPRSPATIEFEDQQEVTNCWTEEYLNNRNINRLVSEEIMNELDTDEYEFVDVETGSVGKSKASKHSNSGGQCANVYSRTIQRKVKVLRDKLFAIAGHIQSGKTAWIIDLIQRIFQRDKSSVVVLRGLGDAFQFCQRLEEFQDDMGKAAEFAHIHSPKRLEVVRMYEDDFDAESMLESLTGRPKVLVGIANESQLSPIYNAFQSAIIPKNVDNSFALFIDESDYIDSGDIKTVKHKCLSILKKYALAVFLISATILDNLVIEEQIVPKRVKILEPSRSYRGPRQFTVIHTDHSKRSSCQCKYAYKGTSELASKYSSKIGDNLLKTDTHLAAIIRRWSKQSIFDCEFYKAKHPRIMLVTIGHTIDPQRRLIKELNKTYPDMTFMMDDGDGIHLLHSSLTSPITLSCGVKSKMIDDIHVFQGVCAGTVLHWLKKNGGYERFHHILITAGTKAGRSISYACKEGINDTLSPNEMPHWHLSEHRLVLGEKTDSPNVIQKCRLATTFEDNIPLTLLVSEDDANAIITSYWTLQDLLNRIKGSDDGYTKQILENLKINRKKFCKGRHICGTKTAKDSITYLKNGISGQDEGMDIDKFIYDQDQGKKSMDPSAISNSSRRDNMVYAIDLNKMSGDSLTTVREIVKYLLEHPNDWIPLRRIVEAVYPRDEFIKRRAITFHFTERYGSIVSDTSMNVLLIKKPAAGDMICGRINK